MILYKKNFDKNKITRKSKEIDIKLGELPTRPIPKFKTPKDQTKYIKTCETVIRKSIEYKEYIKFLKENFDMNKCTVLKNISNKNGHRYRIEIHHEPFTLYDIVETVINKRMEIGESISTLKVADEVMELHYAGKVGLIPLTITMHELLHNGRIFIPLQYIYQDYADFYREYSSFMNPLLIEKIEAKASLSMKSEDIVSDCLDVEFIKLNVDGFDFPSVPKEWEFIFTNE